MNPACSSRNRAGAVASLFLLLLVSCQPSDDRPGLWLSGELAEEPVGDWSFSNSHELIAVETRTAYLIAHSVTVVCAVHAGALYVPSLYSQTGRFPDERHWHRNVARDPRVRLRIGEKLYERRALLVTDAAERAGALAAFAAKYPFWRDLAGQPDAERPGLVFVRLDPR